MFNVKFNGKYVTGVCAVSVSNVAEINIFGNYTTYTTVKIRVDDNGNVTRPGDVNHVEVEVNDVPVVCGDAEFDLLISTSYTYVYHVNYEDGSLI